jgi:hypothetical protein
MKQTNECHLRYVARNSKEFLDNVTNGSGIMRHSVHELRLMLALALRGGTTSNDELLRLVDRRKDLNRAVNMLTVQGAIIMDRDQGKLRLLHGRALELLGLSRMPRVQAEMFSEDCLLPEAQLPPAAVGNSPPQCGGDPAPPCHVHVMSCKNSGSRHIHVMGTRHEVGELSHRTTAEIMADVRRLLPQVAAEHLAHWQERIEREDAFLVNATFRELELQRHKIRNPAGWANANYLKAIRGRQNHEMK